MTLDIPPPEPSSVAAFVDERGRQAAFEELGAEVDAGRGPIDSRLEKRQARRERLRLLIRRPGFVIGTVILVWWIICAIGGDAITPYNPITSFSTPSQPPSTEHWMGTDTLGRDVLSRVMAGARDVLIAAPIAAIISVTLGTIIGLVMGYYRGWVDEVTSRLVEALLSIPLILVALLVVTSLGSSKATVIGTVAILFTPIVARTVRAAVLAESQLDYVTSARLRGRVGHLRDDAGDPAQHQRGRSSSSSQCASATPCSRSPRCRSSAPASSHRRPTGA